MKPRIEKQLKDSFQLRRLKRESKKHIYTDWGGGVGVPETGRAEIEHTARSGLKKCCCYF